MPTNKRQTAQKSVSLNSNRIVDFHIIKLDDIQKLIENTKARNYRPNQGNGINKIKQRFLIKPIFLQW